METKKYYDPVWGDVVLKLIETITVDIELGQKIENIYEAPSGDYIIFTEIVAENLPNSNFFKESYIKKEWLDIINRSKASQEIITTVEEYFNENIFTRLDKQKFTKGLEDKIDIITNGKGTLVLEILHHEHINGYVISGEGWTVNFSFNAQE